jgi:hypothetical protein
MTTTPPDIPPRVTNRPIHKQLSPAENDEFLRKQAKFEAAYRTIGDPQVLMHALLHAWSSKQTIPKWLVWDIGNALIEGRTGEEAERYRERMRHVQRFVVVRDLRRNGHTKDSALDQAVESLASQRAAAPRADSTIYTADSTIPTADTAGGTAVPASTPWFMRIAKR